MAGHSKWHNIRHKKAIQDAKKAKVYAKVAKVIELAAKNGIDPSLNPSLQNALDKAKQNNLPKDVVEKAIKKWSGQIEGEKLEEVFYEWYGPSWVALYIKAITSNTNRTVNNVKYTLSKFKWNLWEPWSVDWQFSEKWIFHINWKSKLETSKWKQIENIYPLDVSHLEEDLLETSVEDYEILDDFVKIITEKKDFIEVKSFLFEKSYNIIYSDIEFIPSNYIQLSSENEETFEKLLEALDDDDDIDEIYHNAN